jgi:hypothetical protein
MRRLAGGGGRGREATPSDTPGAVAATEKYATRLAVGEKDGGL